jgi:hypothetical protein
MNLILRLLCESYSARIDYLDNRGQLAFIGTGSDIDDAADLDEFPPGWLDIDVGHLAGDVRLRAKVS